ncbi:hypothetical protein HPB51_026385 [Rhipicephalus microplus]|uniref:Tick transposon n=1 Tax=Rhipicephalus microplus TaxID=6941 RepID=A0A9J6D3T7_RHIMP|nr:hypothetical protein HPB51_026385 [Rhipicephalus microplus]
MASCILASGRGCSLDIALGFFNAVASARLLYAVPLVALRPAQWDTLDTLHRGVVRCLYGLPRSSPIGPTLAEAGETFLTSGERQCVAPHSPHVPHVRGTTPARRLLDRRHSGMGQRALEYAALVPDPLYCGLLQIPPHQDPGLEIKTTISGIRSKKHTPKSALHQETVAMIEEQLAGRVLMYTNSSVTADGSAAATCFAPSLGLREKCRLPISASTAAAELAAIELAANQLVVFLPQSAAVVCDSRAALLTFVRGERGVPVALRLARRFAVIVRNGCDLVFQWVPSHVGLLGNETADVLAKEAHHLSPPFHCSSVRAMLRTFVLRAMCALHTRTHVWLQETPRDRCRRPASASVPGPSCFGFAPTVPAPLRGRFASPTAGALRVPDAWQRRPPSTSCFSALATLNSAYGFSTPMVVWDCHT